MQTIFSISFFKRRMLAPCAIVLALMLVLALFGFAQWNAQAQDGTPNPETPLANLNIKVTASAQTVRPEGTIGWTIRYTNTTSSAISGVVITSTISDLQDWDETVVSNPPIADFTFTENPDVGGYILYWQIPSIAANSNGEIVFSTQAISLTEPSASKNLTLLGVAAKIISTQSGVTGSENSDVVMVVGPIFEVSKTASTSSIIPGRTVAYTITVSNLARQDAIAATNIVLTDVLPENTQFISASDGGILSRTEEMTAVVWSWAGPLNVGQVKTFSFKVRVNPETGSGTTIKNSKTEYYVSSAEILLDPIVGKKDANVKVLPTLYKTVLAERMQGSTALVYPGDYAVYTLEIFNPLDVPLTGVLVTDTLPGEPMPFSYTLPQQGSPAPDWISEDGRLLVWSVDLPPLGSVTRSFEVLVPRQIAIPENASSVTYKNALAAAHPATWFDDESGLASVKVEAPLTMDKVVKPNQVLNGDTVIYTITLTNDGPYLVANIRLTDTLEGDFIYQAMVSGPDPINPMSTTNPIVWDGLQLAAGEQMKIAFAATAYGSWLSTYKNNLNAYSPDVTIPARKGRASVKILSPLGLNKGVTPSETFVNQMVTYAITVTNLSEETWTLAEVNDHLPTGFYQNGGDNPGGSIAVIDLNANPVAIPPGGEWNGTINVDVTSDVACSLLPKTYKNDTGAVAIHLISPTNLWAVNAAALAPLTVNPNVLATLTPYRATVVPGSLVTYTLKLDNISPNDANNANLQLVLHSETEYVTHISGPAPSVSGLTLSWNNINIPANSTLEIVFQIRVKDTATTGTKKPAFTSSAPTSCIGKLTGTAGAISVKVPVIVLTTKAAVTEAPPLSLVEYELSFKNQDLYPYRLQIITDTMPSGFTFYTMTAGPLPTVAGRNLIWNNLDLPGSKTITYKMLLQTTSLYGNTERNKLDAYVANNATPIIPAYSDSIAINPVFDLKKTVNTNYVKPDGSLVYTITLINLSKLEYRYIRITDTLPTGFTYIRTLEGPTPVQLGSGNAQPVWADLSVRGKCSATNYDPCTTYIVFEAKVGATVPLGRYFNNVIAISPTGAIPGPIKDAPVTVTDNPPPPGSEYQIYLPALFR
ncbi:MAG: hypothetical protein OHK0052_12920 [Anaerolineales bacterium]